MDLAAILGVTPEALRRRTEAVVSAIHGRWAALAPSDAYRACLTSEIASENKGAVKLGFPAVFVERGAPPRDISTPLLRSPRAKVSAKTGARYMSLRMRDGEWRTTSSAKPPWMTKAKPGAGVIKRVLAELGELVAQTRSIR
jgi:hypothetical protein